MTGVLSPAGLPAAAGGVDVAGSLVSVVPGIRKLKRIQYSTTLPAGFVGGKINVPLPKSSYLAKAVIRVSGNVHVIQTASPQTVTVGDPRQFLDRIEFQLSGSTSPRVLNGLQADIIDGLDVPAIAPNASSLTLAGNVNTASATSDSAYVQEWSPLFSVSDQNLFGIPYLGAIATVPQFVLSFKNPTGSVVNAAAGPTITFEAGLVEVELWRVDLPGPIQPQQQTSVVNGQQQTVTIPGQGLYIESSYLLLTKLQDSQDINAANSYKKFKLPIGPDYLRIIGLAYKNGALDDESAPITDRFELVVQQATVIESKKLWQFTNEHKRMFNKARPSGVAVFSGIDMAGTDADIYVSRELGNFDVDWYGSANAPGAGARVEVLTQQLVPLSIPGEYL